MNLPAADLGIMAEHLGTHEGVIHRLKMYYSSVQNPVLKKILELHITVLRDHVRTMLALIDPERTHPVQLQEMGSINWNMNFGRLNEYEKKIALDSRSTAKLMGSNNFNSALLMEDANVKNIHLQMSYQDVSLQMMYDHLIQHSSEEFIPRASKEMQRLTLQHYNHVQNE
ncbi:hypothetical protein [Bacillus sp. FJAT-27251]|uniref:hypothetical protein n=1 Tax=Bacillus sp. FJAT-27251 TaxID=1684142 RepID=UPI0006A79838|nr:hypothetical protein [Bacillus sp. FJAT-27251]